MMWFGDDASYCLQVVDAARDGVQMPLMLAELFRFFIIFVFIPVYTTKPYTHRLVFRMDSRKIKLFIVSFYTLGSLVSFRYPVKVSRSSVGRSKLILPVIIF